MKNLLLPFLLSLTFIVQGQTPDTAAVRVEIDSLMKLYDNLIKEQKLDEALHVMQNAEEICQIASGEETAMYAKIVSSIGIIYYFKGDFSAAEPFWLKAKDIREKVFGIDDSNYASSVNNLGVLYEEMGDFEKAEPLYLESKTIREEFFGKEHPVYAGCLNNMAIFYQKIGHFEKAEQLFLETKSIREKTLKKDHPEYAMCLNNLAVLYYVMGDYEKAELLSIEAKAIWEKILGKDHPDYSMSLTLLAALYFDMGQSQKAEQLYLEANAIRKKALGKEHPEYAKSLMNLANLYSETRQSQKAEQLYLEANAIRKKALGKEHPEYAKSLMNLANLYSHTGQNEKAEQLYLEAKVIREKALGKEHPGYAANLINLANLYSNMRQSEKAEPLYLEGIMIQEKAFGKDHPDYAKMLNILAALYYDLGQYGKAELMSLEANEIEKTLLIKASRHLSERELLTYTNEFTANQSQFFSFAQTQLGLSESAYDNTLFHKGFLLNATQQVNRLAQTDSTSTDMFYHLKAYNRRLATAYSQPLTERDSSTIADMEEKANTLEKELTRSVAGYGEALRQVNWQEVQVQLQTGEAAIEFVHYQYSDPDPTDSTMYAALVLQPGDEQPRFIPLFEEGQIKQVLSGKDQSENIALAYASRGLTPKKKKDLQGLYSLIWQPLEEQLKGVEKVYYSPSGLMHRINFAAIPIDPNQSLSDKYELTRLASTRSLVIADLTKLNSKNEAVLFGGIEYEMQENLASRGEPTEEKTSTRSSELSFSYTDRSTPQRGDNWKYLAGTKSEVENIDQLLNQSKFEVTTFSEMQATEESFKALGVGKASPRILHLATHGFFFPDPKNESQSTLSGQEPVFKISDHPMIRSGLILAGGNHAWKTGKAMYPDMEDGILTAYEISQMDLSHTELVVLSACETGLGDIEGNEGVYGLQRAFKIAGAKYLIMSLWQVPDHQTQELMTLFYSKWLEGKMAIPEAFRAAQKEMRQKYEDPYFWAGFVLVE